MYEVGYLRRNLVCSTATLVQKVSEKWREEEKEGKGREWTCCCGSHSW